MGSVGRYYAAVRRAKPSDAERLAELHVTTWRQAYSEVLPADYLRSLSASQRLPMWLQLLGSGGPVAVFVADGGEGPIGFASGGGSNDGGMPAETGEMWTLYLLRRFWGQGIGRELHDALLGDLERMGFVQATLWVLASNERARRWYEERGWRVDGGEKVADVWGARITEVRYGRRLRTRS